MYIYPDKNLRKFKICTRRFRAESFPYEKVMISVAEKPRPSHRAIIGVNTPRITRNKHTKTVKEEFDIKKNAGIFWKGATVSSKIQNNEKFLTVSSFQNIPAFFWLRRILFLPSWCVYAGLCRAC